MTDTHKTRVVISAFFKDRGLHPLSVPILQPADPFLDMAGEDLRRRIFMTENENGDSLCLRPEFTIPVCLEHIASGTKTPRQYAYLGEVFRQRRDGGNGFYQAGIEDLGDEDHAGADARSLKNALDMVACINPSRHHQTILGDQAVFEAVLRCLGLPLGWQKKLLRAFGNDVHLKHLISDLAAEKRSEILPKVITILLENGNEKELVKYLEEEMFAANISPSAGRSPVEIAKRLLEKQHISSFRLKPHILFALQEFLDIKVTLSCAEQALIDFGKKHTITFEEVLTPFRARITAFKKAGIDLLNLTYDAAFGRPLDYYTGLVYEIGDGERVMIGGGRYDRLLTMLGAVKPIPAIGFSLWIDRMGEKK